MTSAETQPFLGSIQPESARSLRTAIVVGTGFIGTSVALALRRHDVMVYLHDQNIDAARTASEMGAGMVGVPPFPVDLAILAVPPGDVGLVLAEAQRNSLARVYTDVASTKVVPYRDAVEAGCGMETYIGGHPMAGSERSGPAAAKAGLFEGRPWVLTPNAAAASQARSVVLAMIDFCGAVPVVMEAGDHDRAVAVVSHTPHLLATLMAARLESLDEAALGLAGRGMHDVLRIAGGDPHLWADILCSNASAVAEVLDFLAVDMETVSSMLRSLGSGAEPEPNKVWAQIVDLLARGRAGYVRLRAPSEGVPLVR